MVDLVRTPRRPPVPGWAVIVAVAWATLVVVYGVLSRGLAGAPSVCLFRNVSGRPCPTCGGTRAALAALGGRPLEALALNPLLCVLVGALLGALVLRVVFARRVEIRLTPPSRRIAWGALALAFAANWTYLIATG